MGVITMVPWLSLTKQTIAPLSRIFFEATKIRRASAAAACVRAAVNLRERPAPGLDAQHRRAALQAEAGNPKKG